MKEKALQEQIQGFIRSFGLLRWDQTPCGHPIATSQGHALQVLREGELTQQELANRLRLDKSTTSRLVTDMADQGWVSRAVNPENRREVRLTLTPAGRRIAADVAEAALSRYRALLAVIPPEKQDQVLESLSLLNRAIGEE